MTERLPAANYTGKDFIHNDLFSGDTSGLHHHSLLASQALRLQELQKSKIMETVTVTAKTKSTVQILDDKYASGLFKSADSYNFDLVNDQMSNAYPSIFYYLSSKVAGLQINPSSTPPTLQWRGSTPQLFLDEVATDADMVSGIPVTDVAYIKVFRPPFIGATGGGAGGAIAIYTRRGNDIQNKPGQGLTSSTIAGYTPVKQFYSPNYSAFNPRNEQADIRTTLYWNPSLLFDTKNHVSRIVFYNNDVTRSFRVVIEGMTKEGLLTHYEQMME